MASLHRWTLAHPWWVLLLTLLFLLGALSGTRHLSSTTDYRAYFGPNNPELRAFEQIEHQFEQKETLIIALQARSGDMFEPRKLEALREFTEAGWTLPYALRSQSLANHQDSRAEGDDIIVEALVPDGPITTEQAQQIRRKALNSAELVDRFVSRDGTVAAVVVNTPLPHRDLEAEVPEVANAVRALFQDFEQRYPDLVFHASGVVMLNDAMAQTTDHDLRHLFPLTYLLVLVGLTAYFRALLPALLTLAVIFISSLSAYGIAGHLGIVLTAASLASGLIVTTLAVADCVHLLVSWQKRINAGDDKRAALLESLRINTAPVFLTSVTTAIGFLSLEFADSPPFRDLGNIVAAGVLVALVASLFTLPALIMLLPVKVRARPVSGIWPQRFAEFTIRRQTPLLWGGGLVIALLTAGIVHNRFGDNYAEYFAEHIPFRQATDFINERLTGMQNLQFVLHAPEPGGINEPAFLSRLQAFQDWFEAQPETRKVISIVDLHRRLNRTMHGDDPAYDRIPDERLLAAQYLFFYEMSLPQGLSLNTLFDPDKQHTLFVVLLDTIEAAQLAAVNERALRWLQQNQPEGFYDPSGGVGVGLMFARISERNFNSMLVGLAVAIVLIMALMAVLMRSPRIGLISVVPNLVPGLMAFGVWGYSVGKVGISLAVVGSMTLGIVVDDTIHFLSKYLRARRELGASPPHAIHYAFDTVGTALVLTSAILLGGFLAISQSAYQLTAYMGILTAITIALALLADFLFLPPLLLRLDRDKPRA